MDPRFSSAWQKIKARRLGSTMLVVATLVLGILIGTVITRGVKGKEPPDAQGEDRCKEQRGGIAT